MGNFVIRIYLFTNYLYLNLFNEKQQTFMRLALIGYGKMGKTIHEIAQKYGDDVPYIIDKDNHSDIIKMNGDNVDVAIEFSNPHSAFDNIKYCVENGIPVVSGTTGWLDQYDEIVNITKANKGAFMYASNYSIGVNIFFELNKFLAEKMRNYLQYKCAVEEIHHTEKLDAPSGTAITIAEGIIANSDQFKGWINEKSDQNHELSIISKREPHVPGTHIVNYHSQIDEIEIKHTAFSRTGFAQGAYDAAKWLKDRSGVYSIQDMLFG